MQNALTWLKNNNHAYKDIEICENRLQRLPIDGKCDEIATVLFSEDTEHSNDQGPAAEQTEPGAIDGASNSCVLLPDQHVNIQNEVQNIVHDVLGENASVTKNKKGTVTIPWPTRGDVPCLNTQH